MNIKRGLFRLWVVLSAAWVLLVVFFHYDRIASPYFEERAFYFPKGAAEPKTALRYTDDYRALEEAQKRSLIYPLSFKDVPEVTLFVPGDLQKDELDRQTNTAHRLAVSLKETVTQQRRMRELPTAAGIALIPPAVLFVIGWLLLWIGRGFRSTRSY